MALLNWSNELDVGVPSMNDEHKVLLDYMNRLYDRAKAGAQKPELQQILNDLASYTVKHFTDEEKYMESIQFPGLAKHKVIHAELLKKFTLHKEAFNKGDGKLDDSVFSFLKLWLSAHIMGIDTKYGQHKKAA